MGTQKQEFARRRNWMKARIMGIAFDTLVFSESEKAIANSIKANLDILKELWDEQSEKLGMKLKPHKCYFCGKRSNVERILSLNHDTVKRKACKKHYNEFKENGEEKN